MLERRKPSLKASGSAVDTIGDCLLGKSMSGFKVVTSVVPKKTV